MLQISYFKRVTREHEIHNYLTREHEIHNYLSGLPNLLSATSYCKFHF